MAFFIAGVLLFLAYTALINQYGRWWNRIEPVYPDYESDLPDVRVSVVIAARNEAVNLPTLFDALRRQTYPASLFEVLIVNDRSTDDTAAIAGAEGGNVCLLSLPPGAGSKKKAIAAGIEAATGTLIITTDADCIPPRVWIETLVRFHAETGAVFIAAPVRYRYRNRLVELFQTIDFLTLQGITAASVSSSFHTMCNGANLAYTKEAFLAVGGFAGIDKLASGDDMLLMHKIWKREPKRVHYVMIEEAIVDTAPMPTWREFFWQRIRWASKSAVYDDKRIIWALLLVYLFNCLFPVLAIGGFWKPTYWAVLPALLLLKTVVELPFVLSVARFFGQARILVWFPLFQPLHILYTVGIGLLSQVGSYRWKGRKTK
jgi:cellulose synthase/poly-beta-1,6-N-acetylglucosamine synthase-like glycosyltransferase